MSTPVVTPVQMRRIDANCGVGEPELIERAGTAVAWTARSMMGGVYGRRVIVLAGPGKNGADGRVAARHLRAWGVRVSIVEINRSTPPPPFLEPADLVIDAVLGTGVVRPYRAPALTGRAQVLAVDIASGIDAVTGEISAGCHVMSADVTLTFVALKPGLVFEPGASRAGEIRIADLGLSHAFTEDIRVHMIDERDARRRVPLPRIDAHKWNNAVLVVAGSPGMTGAGILCAQAAGRAGARMLRLAIPGALHSGDEIVGIPLPAVGWATAAAEAAQRCAAVVLGPGLGRDPQTLDQVRQLLLAPELRQLPVVVDADGLAALTPELLRARAGLTLVTPHDGEFARLTGAPISSNRIEAVRIYAQTTSSVVLLKGPATVVATPDGHVELVRAGDQRLATAGSGDVLSGILGALLSQGVTISQAAAAGAVLHGCAALRGHRVGLLAGDLPDLVAQVLSEWESDRRS